MQRSSETIGAIASALAKAQIELTNPEKSLTATIVSPFPREENKTFRYASLSSGLEIVRKCLGRHEIAAVQTTAIDKETGLIRLTTTLAHASGEWMASEWPVCPVSETSAPHRLGAALTYARRHSLFTLVGIAGDDDTDAPDLNSGASAAFPGARNGQNGAGQGNGFVPGAAAAQAFPTAVNGRRRPGAGIPPPLLPESHSARERDRLLEELEGVAGADALGAWAQAILPIKNTLLVGDARILEVAFAARLAATEDAALPPVLGGPASAMTMEACWEDNPAVDGLDKAVAAGTATASRLPPACSAASPPSPRRRRNGHPPAAAGIDKSVLAFPEPKRIRDKEHLKYVGTQPCLICGRTPSDAHHIRFAQLRALGRKVSDEFTVPVCRTHHREIHRFGDELAWWTDKRLDPLPLAETLWRRTHPLPVPGGVDQTKPTTAIDPA